MKWKVDFPQKKVDLSCIVPKSNTFLDATLLSPLHLFASTADSVSLANGILVAKPMLNKQFGETDLSNKHFQRYINCI